MNISQVLHQFFSDHGPDKHPVPPPILNKRCHWHKTKPNCFLRPHANPADGRTTAMVNHDCSRHHNSTFKTQWNHPRPDAKHVPANLRISKMPIPHRCSRTNCWVSKPCRCLTGPFCFSILLYKHSESSVPPDCQHQDVRL